MTIIIMIIKKTLGTFELLQSSTQKWGQWGKLLKHQRPLLGSDVVCLSIKCDNVLPTPSGRTPKDTHLFSDSSHWKIASGQCLCNQHDYSSVRKKAIENKNKVSQSRIITGALSLTENFQWWTTFSIINHSTGKKTKTHYISYYWWWWCCRKLKFIGAPRTTTTIRWPLTLVHADDVGYRPRRRLFFLLIIIAENKKNVGICD